MQPNSIRQAVSRLGGQWHGPAMVWFEDCAHAQALACWIDQDGIESTIEPSKGGWMVTWAAANQST